MLIMSKNRTGIDVSEILVTQSGLRDKSQLPNMIKFLKSGGLFDEDTLGSYAIRHGLARVSPLIEIARFEDGILAIHNGHHRVVSAFLARQNRKIYTDEFFIRDWHHSDYKDIVLPNWVTPFNVLEEVRVEDLAEWKKKVREFYINHGEESTKDFIIKNHNEYCMDRTFYTVGDMVSRLGLYAYRG